MVSTIMSSHVELSMLEVELRKLALLAFEFAQQLLQELTCS
jgi:hypothetical protein